MKNIFKFLFTTLLVLVVSFAFALTVFAEENRELYYENQEPINGYYSYEEQAGSLTNALGGTYSKKIQTFKSQYKLAVHKNETDSDRMKYDIYTIVNNRVSNVILKNANWVTDVHGTIYNYYNNGDLYQETDITISNIINGFNYPYNGSPYYYTNMPIFSNKEDLDNYLLNGVDEAAENIPITDYEDMELNRELYLKNIRWKTEAVTGNGGKEDCWCFMSWDTDNLTENDFINVRSDLWYQHYVLGKKVSGSYNVFEMEKRKEFMSTSWSHAYGYGLDLQDGTFSFDYLTMPMLYANTIETIDNIYNGGVNTLYLQLIRFNSETGKYTKGLWVKVSFKDSLVSYADIDNINAGIIDEETGEYEIDPETDYGLDGYGVNGETGNKITAHELGSLDSIDEVGEYIFAKMRDMITQLGNFPTLVFRVFSFLPSDIMILIGVGIVIAILLRILGR